MRPRPARVLPSLRPGVVEGTVQHSCSLLLDFGAGEGKVLLHLDLQTLDEIPVVLDAERSLEDCRLSALLLARRRSNMMKLLGREFLPPRRDHRSKLSPKFCVSLQGRDGERIGRAHCADPP